MFTLNGMAKKNLPMLECCVIRFAVCSNMPYIQF